MRFSVKLYIDGKEVGRHPYMYVKYQNDGYMSLCLFQREIYHAVFIVTVPNMDWQ